MQDCQDFSEASLSVVGKCLTKIGSSIEEDPEEELLFDMSELEHALNRRSIEESRGAGAGSAPDRGGYDSSRAGNRRW